MGLVATSWRLEGSSEESGVDGLVVGVGEAKINSLVCKGIDSIDGVALRLIDVWIASGGCCSLCDAVGVSLAVVVVGVRDWKVCG